MFLKKIERFRGGLVFKAHGSLCHSTLGSRVIKKKRKIDAGEDFDDHVARDLVEWIGV